MKLRPKFSYHQNDTAALMAHTLNTRYGFPTRFHRANRPVFVSSVPKHMPSHPIKALIEAAHTRDYRYQSKILSFIATAYVTSLDHSISQQTSFLHFENERPVALLNVPAPFLYDLTAKPYPSAS